VLLQWALSLLITNRDLLLTAHRRRVRLFLSPPRPREGTGFRNSQRGCHLVNIYRVPQAGLEARHGVRATILSGPFVVIVASTGAFRRLPPETFPLHQSIQPRDRTRRVLKSDEIYLICFLIKINYMAPAFLHTSTVKKILIPGRDAHNACVLCFPPGSKYYKSCKPIHLIHIRYKSYELVLDSV